MKPASFEYHAPHSVEETVALLAEYGDEAKLLAGGQSLVPILALRLTRFDHLIDLNTVDELAYIRPDDDALVVGAMTRQSTAEHSAEVVASVPLLARAIPHIGHFQIRNRGTIGGSISHADPASELPAVACALDAEIEIAGPSGIRRVPSDAFFVSTWETAVAPDEVTVALRFPTRTPRRGFAIEEVASRRGDFAIAGVACALGLSGSGTIEHARIAFMGMGPTPMRVTAVEDALLGRRPEDLDLDEAAVEAVALTAPSADVHASSDYRARVARALFIRAVRSALEEAVNA